LKVNPLWAAEKTPRLTCPLFALSLQQQRIH
jgi:hypothetical protein